MKFIWLLDTALVAVVGIHLLIAPYTKVEELFNIQAIHDIINYGVFPPQVLQNFDHNSFPGVVPRTFVGSVVIAGIVKVIDIIYAVIFGESFVADGSHGQLHVQIIARGVLALLNVWGFFRLRASLGEITVSDSVGLADSVSLAHSLDLEKEYLTLTLASLTLIVSRRTAQMVFTLMLLSQFHVIFYASRTLPNFMVLPLVNFGLSKIIRGDLTGLTWLAFSGVVFRLEVGVFASVIALVSSLIFGQSNVFQAGFLLVVGSLVGLALTYTVDTYFWGKATLPEIQAFVFNVVEGKSVEWGVEPYSAYFTKYIVNLFRPPHVLVLSVFGLLRDPAKSVEHGPRLCAHPARNSLRVLGLSGLIFVLIMSYQPHKEWRFIIYIASPLTLLASNGFVHLLQRSASRFTYKVLVFLMLASTLASLAISSFMAYASSYNYPGGAAVNFVNGIVGERPDQAIVTVHMDVPACMTGITHFTELHHPKIVFDKTESEHSLAKIWNEIDYLITQKDMLKPLASDLVVYDANHWLHLTLIKAFAGVDVGSFVRNMQMLAKNETFRADFVGSVWLEMKHARFHTLLSFLEKSILLRDALHVYKRTAPDIMPTILEVDSEKEKAEVEELLKKEYEEQVAEQIDPRELRELVNEQIDELEDFEERSISDEL